MEKINLKICCGMNCLTHGGQELLDLAENDSFIQKYCKIESVPCQNSCGNEGVLSPTVVINNEIYSSMTADKLMEIIRDLKG
ncbi:NAD(P)H-dependent oxidoreductase subunit E [Candidatus Lokiarchaeum ossiferum]|uniref:NAD(P)H-dependent oxidoreductase subunit E n=1 Tax=Candidatus Lokiarchaeum ossiferum TaxID=2951803 RepID=UPI00352FC821